MFDTHAHLNFSRFKKNVDDVISRAKKAGVTHFVIPGTDIESSRKAVEIAEKHKKVYAAIGIHPHHVYEYISRHSEGTVTTEETRAPSGIISIDGILRSFQDDIKKLAGLVSHPKVVAIGEIGLDRHVYKETKYEQYHVTEDFIHLQRQIVVKQLELAIQHHKSVILHNREAAEDILELMTVNWNMHFEGRTVFHCCEPDYRLLEFAKKHHAMIGIDGDITYDPAKQAFLKEVPLDLLVVETDSPFLLPEPMRSRKEFPNEPKNIPHIISTIARITEKPEEEINKRTHKNAQNLFNL